MDIHDSNYKIKFTLQPKELERVIQLQSKGVRSARTVRRARTLELFHTGLSASEIAVCVGLHETTVRNIAHRYLDEGLDRALYDKPRPGQKRRITEKQIINIIALVCSDAPEGFARWTIALITEEVIKKEIVSTISRESIRIILKNTELKPWREKMWCVPKLNEEYTERMEDVLDLYEKPYDPNEPVVCLDEKPVQLLDDLRDCIPVTKPGQILKRDHHYKRMGMANVFCVVEPKAGRHFTYPTKNKKGPEFAKVLLEISNNYPGVETIHLVLDNYSTHTKKSLIRHFGEEKGEELWNRFTIHKTPVNGSWLDQAEIEIGIYSKQCLGKRRISDFVTLKKETEAWNKKVNQQKLKINWKFTTSDARRKLKYEKTE